MHRTGSFPRHEPAPSQVPSNPQVAETPTPAAETPKPRRSRKPETPAESDDWQSTGLGSPLAPILVMVGLMLGVGLGAIGVMALALGGLLVHQSHWGLTAAGAIGLLIFAAVLHLPAYAVVGRFADLQLPLDKSSLIVLTATRTLSMPRFSADQAGQLALRHEVVNAGLERIDRDVFADRAGHDHERKIEPAIVDDRERFEPGEFRHRPVGDHDIPRLAVQELPEPPAEENHMDPPGEPRGDRHRECGTKRAI